MIIKKSKSIREQVYEYLKKEIVNGIIGEGTRIVEEEYAEKLNVSRTPLREALRMLEFEGLVEAREKGGVTVPKTTIKDVEEILKIRISLEELIIKEIFLKNSEELLEDISNILIETEKIIGNSNKVEEVFKYFSKFNELLYKMAELPRVTTLINNLNLYLKKFRKLSIKNIGRRIKAHNEHKELIDAIKCRDEERALEINKKHLIEAMEFLIVELQK